MESAFINAETRVLTLHEMDDNLGIILFVAILAFIGFLVWLVKYVQKTSTGEQKKELGSAFKHLGLALVIGILYWILPYFFMQDKIGGVKGFLIFIVILQMFIKRMQS